MNKNIFLKTLATIALGVAYQGAMAQNSVTYDGPLVAPDGTPMNVVCKKASLTRNGDEFSAKMDLDFSGVKIRSNQAAVFTPLVVNGEDTLRLPGISIYGRTRWYQFERMDRRPLSGDDEISIRAGKQGLLKYSEQMEYENWMNGSTLMLERKDYGCAGCTDPIVYAPANLAYYRVEVYRPTFEFIAAEAEAVKTRNIEGRAYIDFPVNRIEIFPDYRRNTVELGKIIATIDSVRNDKDITVKSIAIKGFASPEGPYDNNVRLAKGRTEALKNYVQQLYMFPYGFIQTSYEPEDWAGLREYVEKSTMPNKMGLLAIIDSTLEPDPKNSKIEKDFPQDYKFLLQTVYPGLRHSDYKIGYEIRGFEDVNEIAEVMRTNPSKLSLNEMYTLAGTYLPGSPEYTEVMETAARMFPNDYKAILNAGIAAMQRGDLVQAERYINRAGTTGDALF